MLVAAVLHHDCLGPEALSREDRASALAFILRAVAKKRSIILLAANKKQLRRALRQTAEAVQSSSTITPKTKKNLDILLTTLSNSFRGAVAFLPNSFVVEDGASPTAQAAYVARHLDADIVVISGTTSGLELSHSCGDAVEVCELSSFRESRAEERRDELREAMDLGSCVTAQEAEDLACRAIKYERECIEIVDPYIGLKTSPDDRAKALRGIFYFERLWREHSPYREDCRLRLCLYTKPNYDRPSVFEDIRGQMKELGSEAAHSDTGFRIALKDFCGTRDRYVVAAGRTWQIDHGMDSFDPNSSQAEAPGLPKQGAKIHPHSDDNAALVSSLRTERDVESPA